MLHQLSHPLVAVLLAALAGIFYGLAWRQARRVGASTITHASVDTIWGIWLR